MLIPGEGSEDGTGATGLTAGRSRRRPSLFPALLLLLVLLGSAGGATYLYFSRGPVSLGPYVVYGPSAGSVYAHVTSPDGTWRFYLVRNGNLSLPTPPGGGRPGINLSGDYAPPVFLAAPTAQQPRAPIVLCKQVWEIGSVTVIRR